jgi:hypothetical protein
MKNLWVKTGGKIVFQSANSIRVRYGFSAENKTYIGPANGSTITAGDIRFFVGGTDAQCDFAKAVIIAPNSTVFANFYAPSGTVFLDNATVATGAFLGKDVVIGCGVRLALATSFSGLAKQNGESWTLAPEDASALPEVPPTYSLSSNYPNPFNPSTQIRYGLPKAGNVTLTIHNVLGQEVARIVDEAQPEGYHEVRWDGTNQTGTGVGTGIYFYRLRAGDFSETRRMLLVK